jgi:long-chain acyl-CoA synthetase
MFKSKYGTIIDIYKNSTTQFAGRPFLAEKKNGVYVWTSYREFGAMVDAARGGLAALGVGKGDRVAVISDNCIPWAVMAFAAYGLGAWYVPMYEAQLPKEWDFIINDCEAKVVLAGSPAIAEKLAALASPSVKNVVVLRDGAKAPKGALSFEAVLEKGKTNPVGLIEVKPDDLATLIYTSGTTGKPKGVMLTHSNIACNLSAVQDILPVDSAGETSLAFLPWAHCYGQVAELFLGFATGGKIALAESPTTLLTNLVEVKPTILFSVPRVWNKVYANLHKRMRDAGGVKLALFNRALKVAAEREELALKGKSSMALDVQYKALDKLVFSKIRAALGGNLKYAASGAAALSPEVAKFISYIGITVCEGYGLTETSPVATNNSPGKGRIGTVGLPLPGVEIKIRPAETAPAGQGEIVIYGHNVMKGYYNRPEDTKAALQDDGGFRTGDMGYVDGDGYLHITGRVKEQFKLENGKYVAPAPLEEQLKLSPYMAQVFIYGANKPFNVALIVLNAENIPTWAAENGLTGKSLAELCKEPKVRALVKGELTKYGEDFKGFEKIENFALLHEEFTSENGMLTPSLKIKRNIVNEKFKDVLEGLYKGSAVGA